MLEQSRDPKLIALEEKLRKDMEDFLAKGGTTVELPSRESLTPSRFDDIEEYEDDDLVSASEIANPDNPNSMLNITHNMFKTGVRNGRYPAPVAYDGNNSLWLRSEIEELSRKLDEQ